MTSTVLSGAEKSWITQTPFFRLVYFRWNNNVQVKNCLSPFAGFPPKINEAGIRLFKLGKRIRIMNVKINRL